MLFQHKHTIYCYNKSDLEVVKQANYVNKNQKAIFIGKCSILSCYLKQLFNTFKQQAEIAIIHNARNVHDMFM